MVLKEFRICMPMTVEEYQKGQLYMISRHSDEQSESGEGVEVVKNESCSDEEYGNGQYTEKKIHLNKRLPTWAASFFPTISVTEKAWNFYPYTITEYECPWIPRLQIFIETRYEDNNGRSNNCPKCKMHERVTESEFAQREISFLDIAHDKVPDKHYKDSEDCTKFKSVKTGRGPLKRNWMESIQPIMCSYKLVHVKFEVWGMQTRVENYILKVVRDILLLGHRQAFAWIDVWYDMTFESIRDYETRIQSSTNLKVLASRADNLSKDPAKNGNLASKQPPLSTSSSLNSSASDLS